MVDRLRQGHSQPNVVEEDEDNRARDAAGAGRSDHQHLVVPPGDRGRHVGPQAGAGRQRVEAVRVELDLAEAVVHPDPGPSRQRSRSVTRGNRDRTREPVGIDDAGMHGGRALQGGSKLPSGGAQEPLGLDADVVSPVRQLLPTPEDHLLRAGQSRNLRGGPATGRVSLEKREERQDGRASQRGCRSRGHLPSVDHAPQRCAGGGLVGLEVGRRQDAAAGGQALDDPLGQFATVERPGASLSHGLQAVGQPLDMDGRADLQQPAVGIVERGVAPRIPAEHEFVRVDEVIEGRL